MYRKNAIGVEIPLTSKERWIKVGTFLKAEWKYLVGFAIVIAVVSYILLHKRGCIEGAAIMQPGQVVNCSIAEETLHISTTNNGETLATCICPGRRD